MSLFSCLSCLIGLQECSFPQFLVRVLQLSLRVHHDWAVPRHWFLERFAGNQQEADAILARTATPSRVGLACTIRLTGRIDINLHLITSPPAGAFSGRPLH